MCVLNYLLCLSSYTMENGLVILALPSFRFANAITMLRNVPELSWFGATQHGNQSTNWLVMWPPYTVRILTLWNISSLSIIVNLILSQGESHMFSPNPIHTVERLLSECEAISHGNIMIQFSS